MENEFDYYMINNTGESNVPLLMNNDDVDPEGTYFVYRNEFAKINKPVYLALNPPIPSKPNLNIDYLELPSAVFSQRIADVLLSLKIKGHQLVPAIIVDKKGEEHNNFWIENVYTKIKCFDEEKSKFKISRITKSWTNIEKIVLNKDSLSIIPLNERLVFRASESRQFLFYHKTIVDAIMSVNPINVRFTSVESWFEGIQFRG